MESNHESYIRLLAEQARALSPDIRQWRSRLHCHPELSGQENDTMAFVCKQLETGWVFPGSGSSTAAWPPPLRPKENRPATGAPCRYGRIACCGKRPESGRAQTGSKPGGGCFPRMRA